MTTTSKTRDLIYQLRARTSPYAPVGWVGVRAAAAGTGAVTNRPPCYRRRHSVFAEAQQPVGRGYFSEEINKRTRAPAIRVS